MKLWVNRALALLHATLEPPQHELNELDWKLDLSDDKKRLTEHISAFGNHPGGGYLVFGISNAGVAAGIERDAVERIVGRLANLGRDAVEPQVAIDHAVETFADKRVLLVRIPESGVKPVQLRGKGLDHSFIRSGSATRQASRQEIGHLLLHSRTPRWEELHASNFLDEAELLDHLMPEPILELLERPFPSDKEALLIWTEKESFITRVDGGGYITNLGAIAAAKDLNQFPDLSRKSVRVIVYKGSNEAETEQHQEGRRGYAVSFQRLMGYVTTLLPQSEVIEQALRVKKTLYPDIALREIIANALIHQDFSVSGTSPMIEIFSNRIEISNPGGLLPSKTLHRLIGTQPESRNELLAKAFRRYKICEEQGSGLIKAGLAVELYGLPPIQFSAGPNHFKVTLYAPRSFADMTPRERLDACYQHAVLRYLSGSRLTNTSLRERLKMPERQRSMVSVLIQEALDAGLIKPSNPDNRSRKFSEYIPSWA